MSRTSVYDCVSKRKEDIAFLNHQISASVSVSVSQNNYTMRHKERDILASHSCNTNRSKLTN